MKNEQCPICFGELEEKLCNPCHDCGHRIELNQDLSQINIYEIYQDLTLQLCNFCAVDFGSYQPEYFGCKNIQRIGFGDFNFVKTIYNPSNEIDKYCPICDKRLKFLNFLRSLRDILGKDKINFR